MPTPDPWSGIDVLGPNDSSDLSVLTGNIAGALRGKTAKLFESLSARDDAFAALTDEQKAGSVVGIRGSATGGGIWWYDGAAWRKIPLPGLDYQYGVVSTSTNSVGLFSIDHTLGVSALGAQMTPVYYGPSGAAERVMNRTKLSIREFQVNRVVGYAGDVHAPDSPVADAMIVVSYRFEKFLV